ncbi:MAG: NmrA family NAD(P)-binding protein [Acidocella sp.]|nr:NmrA family NAD(P)-binding protein [Acidocella sp.]
MDKTSVGPVLVLGGTGAQGGGVVRALLMRQIPVRALVRDPASVGAAQLQALGATLAIGNFEDPASLTAACEAAYGVFSVQNAAGTSRDPDREKRDGANIIEAAKAAGVTHMVHTSVSGAGAFHRAMPGWSDGKWSTLENYWESKAFVEDAVRNAGFSHYTIIKPAFMMENFIPPKAAFMFPDLAARALVTALLPTTKLALVAADDVGNAAAAAIADPAKFSGAEIELGGDWLTMDEIATTLSAIINRQINASSLSPEKLIARGQFPGWVKTQDWLNKVGYPARPQAAHAFDLQLVDFKSWAATHAEAIAMNWPG